MAETVVVQHDSTFSEKLSNALEKTVTLIEKREGRTP